MPLMLARSSARSSVLVTMASNLRSPASEKSLTGSRTRGSTRFNPWSTVVSGARLCFLRHRLTAGNALIGYPLWHLPCTVSCRRI